MHETHVAGVGLLVADDDSRRCRASVSRLPSLSLRPAFHESCGRFWRTTEIRNLSSARTSRRRRRRVIRQRLRLDDHSSDNAVADADFRNRTRLFFILFLLLIIIITVVVVVVVAVCFRLIRFRSDHQVDVFQLRQFADDVNGFRVTSCFVLAVRVLAISPTVRRRRR